MKASDVKDIKTAIKNELKRRNGFGSVAGYASSAYDLSKNPTVGENIRPEYGEKTIDLLLKICDYKDLRLTEKYGPIPTAFTRELIDFVNNTLAKEIATGESEATILLDGHTTKKAEVSSCRGDCTGLCVGSCINYCNGCSSCTASCGSSCATGCNSSCSGGDMAYSGY